MSSNLANPHHAADKADLRTIYRSASADALAEHLANVRGQLADALNANDDFNTAFLASEAGVIRAEQRRRSLPLCLQVSRRDTGRWAWIIRRGGIGSLVAFSRGAYATKRLAERFGAVALASEATHHGEAA